MELIKGSVDVEKCDSHQYPFPAWLTGINVTHMNPNIPIVSTQLVSYITGQIF